MKKTINLLLVFILVSNISCNKETLLEEKTIFIEGNPFQLMEIANLDLMDGVYDANINDVFIKVIAQKGIVKWIMPEMNDGEYRMIFPKQDTNYKVNVLIKNNAAIEDANAYLKDFINEVDIGLTATQIAQMTADSQLKYAKFLAINRDEILKNVRNEIQHKNSACSTTLSVNQSISLNVLSEKKWNSSGICITAGEVYQISASGIWTDWCTDTDANGYSDCLMDLFGFLRRAPNHDWFKLMASIGRQKNYPIGISQQITATESGQLEFYANDVLGFYWNNIGSIGVTVTRVY